VRARSPVTLNLQIERVHCPPWGLAGGNEGKGNQVLLRLDGREIGNLANGKVWTRVLNPGDAFTLRSGGGGGFGPAIERDPESVAEDVVQEYVSRDAARDIYGVVLTGHGRVDYAATERLRAQMSGASDAASAAGD
jgi:N-methylhydantoinase B